MKKEKVLFVMSVLGLGGAQRQAIVLAKWLKYNKNMDVEFISFEIGHKNATILLDEANIRWSIMPIPFSHSTKKMLSPKILLSYVHFIWKIRQLKPTYILSYMDSPNIVMGLTWKFTGAKNYIWGQEDIGLGLRKSRITAIATKHTPYFISNSPMGAAGLQNIINVPPSKIFVVPNGIEDVIPKYTTEHWNTKTGKTSKYIMATMVANISKYKNHETLINAWRLVMDEWKGDAMPLLCLAGEPSSKWDEVNKQIDTLNLRNNVVLTGFVDDIPGILLSTDFAVFPTFSFGEGFPNGVMESMAAGLAVVGSDVQSINLLVAKENYSLLSKPEDERDLADKLLYALNNLELLKSIGAANKQRIKEEFSVEQLGNKTFAILTKNAQ